jgi:hypothetical protein
VGSHLQHPAHSAAHRLTGRSPKTILVTYKNDAHPRWLARSAGAACQVVYLPVDKDVQLACIAHRQETTPHQTFPMSEAEVDAWGSNSRCLTPPNSMAVRYPPRQQGGRAGQSGQ